jgi:hypothetical protein
VLSTDERVMVDREVALTFKDTSTKTRIFEEITAPYLDAVKTVAEVPGQHPTSFGGECDLLAVDARGRLLAVEIKPRNVSSIAWAGIQATIYAGLFTRWLRSPRSAAADQPEVIIRDMLDQRTRLGLASPKPRGAPRQARGGARRGNSTRLTGRFPRSPQICTQDHPRLTWLRRNQPGGLRSQHDRSASTTCPLITVSSRTPRCRPTTVGLEGRCSDRPDGGRAAVTGLTTARKRTQPPHRCNRRSTESPRPVRGPTKLVHDYLDPEHSVVAVSGSGHRMKAA